MAKEKDVNKVSSKNYLDSLSPEVKKRYLEKISHVNGVDPYKLKKSECIMLIDQKSNQGLSHGEGVDNLPSVHYPDIYNYLISGVSAYTHDQLKNYKSLLAYDQFVCGFVNKVCVKVIDNCSNVIVKSQVLHSQRLRETPLKTWFIAGVNGTILSAHCTCMAGLDECCTHVAALLFYVEYAVRYRETITVTGKKAYWKVPTVKEVKYGPVVDLKLTSAKAKQKVLDESLNDSVKVPKTNIKKRSEIDRMSYEQFNSRNKRLFEKDSRAAIFRLLPHYYNNFIPKCLDKMYPVHLPSLFCEEKAGLPFSDLLNECEKIVLDVSKEQIVRVEKETREQAKSSLWQRIRSGRITASNLKAACHTNPAMPSLSLIKTICYPASRCFSTEATKWGIQNEDQARKVYSDAQKEKHKNLSVTKSGIWLHEKYPHLGASPDGMLHCDCCGKGVLEIKCPFTLRDTSIKNNFLPSYFEDTDHGYKLRKSHEYFYQVQAQIHLTNASYADFCIWTKVDYYIERIAPDESFWQSTVTKAENFFKCAILPELVGHFFTTSQNSSAKALPAAMTTTLVSPRKNNPCSSSTMAAALVSPRKNNPCSSSTMAATLLSPSKTKCTTNVSSPSTSPRKKLSKILSPIKNSSPSNNADDDDDDSEVWCYCRQKESGTQMIACDNENCKITWFHTACLKIEKLPPKKKKWFCPDCSKSKPSRRNKKAKQL